MSDLVVTSERSVAEVTSQVAKIQDLMAKVMQRDEHYGVIPGTGKKPSLLKAGAEKLCFVFRLVPSFEVKRDDLPNGHREYTVTCTLKTMEGVFAGEGVGSCSTMESKYRYRNASDYEVLDEPIPEDSKERKEEYRKQGFGMKKVDGVWCWVKYTSEGKVENPDIADVYNTVLKMAKKRAHVDATITATAASDIFTQDVEDMPEFEGRAQPNRTEQSRSASPAKSTTPASQGDVDGLILAAIATGKLSKQDADMWRGKIANGNTKAAAESYIRATFGGLAPVKSAPMSAGKEAAIDAESIDDAADEGFGDPPQPEIF